jgi:exopolysaccharide biosynthesis WecB/TagA/CpsF family protein
VSASTRPVAPPSDDAARNPAADRLAEIMLAGLSEDTGRVVTWLNHYTAMQSMQDGVPLDQFDCLGLDGILLRHLVDADVPRTSADLVLPVVLEHPTPLRIALIGSTAETLAGVAAKIEAKHGHDVVLVRDGYAGLPDPVELRRQLQDAGVQVAVVGLGAPLQDRYALALRSPGLLVATCGGWLDQFAAGSYYPSWAYPLRLNWLVRLAREPQRLWRRYSVDALRAVRARAALTDYVTGLGGRPLHTAASASRPTDAPAA